MFCSNGTLSKANSAGMDDFNNGVLAKSSFEKVLYHLNNASLTGSEDTISGISSNIMVGHVAPCGTGSVNVSIDEKAKLKMLNSKSSSFKKKNKYSPVNIESNNITFDID